VLQQTASQFASTQHALPPAEGLVLQMFFGSLQSVYSVPMPEQQAVGVVVSVVEPTQVHTPATHIPERQPSLPVHAEPLCIGAVHVPESHQPDVQPSSPAHAPPFDCFAAQVPVRQRPESQSASSVQALPFAWGPHDPSTHGPAVQSAASVHDAPLAWGSWHVPPLHTRGAPWQSPSLEHGPPCA
jgi:hypothetical protein